MSSSEQLEREAERTRSQLANSLDELRASMTPGNVLDQLSDYASDGAGAAFARNLKRQIVDNPLPAALIGAGLAWLILGGRTGDGSTADGAAQRMSDSVDSTLDRTQSATEAAGERLRRKASDASDAASNAASGAAATARSAAQAVSDSAATARDTVNAAAGRATDSVKQTASMAYDTVADGARRTASAMSGSTKNLGRRTMETGGSFLNFCQEQPLVIVGIGVALGAAIGTLLPRTETEDRLMGETSDAVKDQVQQAASETFDAQPQSDKGRAADDHHAGGMSEHDGSSDEHRAAGEAASLVPAVPEESHKPFDFEDGKAREAQRLDAGDVGR